MKKNKKKKKEGIEMTDQELVEERLIDFNYKFNQLELALMMYQDTDNKELYLQTTVQNIIETQFQHSQ